MANGTGPKKARTVDSKPAAKTARERKAAFDERMKNKGRRIDPNQPERSACVLYLSQPARLMLIEHREQAKVVMDGPRLDSQLVETLLMSMQETATLNAASRIDRSKTELELRRSNKLLRERIVDLRRTLQETTSRLADVEAQLPGTLYDRHRDAFSHTFSAMLSDVLNAIRERGTSASVRHDIHRLLMDYMLGLLELG